MTHKDLFCQVVPTTAVSALAFLIAFVDRSMVARISIEALAAIGITPAIIGFGIGATTGLVTFVQKRVAAAEGKDAAISSALLLSLIISVPFSIAVFFASPFICQRFFTGTTASLAQQYMQIMAFTVPLNGVNQVTMGYWVGSLKSHLRLRINVVTTILSIGLHLIIIPILGVQGAALSSLLTMLFSAVVNFTAMKKVAQFKFSAPTEMKMAFQDAYQIFLHQIAFHIQTNIFNYLVAHLSVAGFAVYNVINTFLLIPSAIGSGYGLIGGSYLLAPYKNADHKEMHERFNKLIRQSVVVGLILGMLAIILETLIRKFYFGSTDAFAISKFPYWTFVVLCVVDIVCCLFQRVHYSLDNIASSLKRLLVSQWLVGTPLAWIAVILLKVDIGGFFAVYAFERVFLTAILADLWRRRFSLPRGQFL